MSFARLKKGGDRLLSQTGHDWPAYMEWATTGVFHPRVAAIPWARLRPGRRYAAGQRAISVAEADGNRTRRRALARPPILKACPTLALPPGL